jgi:hypothetical protein
MKLKRTTLDFWYKKNYESADPNSEIDEVGEWLHAQEEEHHKEEEIPMQPPPKIQRIAHEGTSVLEVERDPSVRCQIWEYPPDEQDRDVKAYMKHGPYQFLMDVYPPSGSKKHPRRFQSHWFRTFPWLEYSPTKDVAFCFPCFLFFKKLVGKKMSYCIHHYRVQKLEKG